jgi:DNA-binding response OmpR family regulator
MGKDDIVERLNAMAAHLEAASDIVRGIAMSGSSTAGQPPPLFERELVVIIDEGHRLVLKDDSTDALLNEKRVHLSPQAFSTLWLLAKYRGLLVPYSRIIGEALLGSGGPSDVTTLIWYIRQKLPCLRIENVRGRGYRLTLE